MISKDLVAASATHLILSILADGESYGYAIIGRVRDLSDGEIAWTDGMLYPVLHRLQRRGLIDSSWRRADTGRRRKYYRLLPAGEEALVREREQWMTVHRTLEKTWAGTS